ncbi:DNA-binding protein [Sinanaerobacter sp. ZZT-01]|uniref:DNA-binding protein n=1 Tax=Sinanaerobacter sp. ZZT-01 TaxID=3111540 RepID=UPI002D796BFC|nr:DNA-binding protein [Sinanaerobacter sp. ZZT-01]WRR93820.1 DNA-binding protein [Sinanaerobacter sp. ZZT-01]
MLDYISVQQAAVKWKISERRIQKLCEENRIDGAVRFGHAWAIPKDASKPADGRLKENRKKE